MNHINSYKRKLKTRNVIQSSSLYKIRHTHARTHARREKGKRNVVNKRARVNRAKRWNKKKGGHA